ncbi:MAG: DUF305 domain-containing protein [Gordonia polyisoprenivorans]|nr:DUF305 domain-containing protein [Gordonia polyisoprenivorans]
MVAVGCAAVTIVAGASGCSMGGMDMGGSTPAGSQTSSVAQDAAYNQTDVTFARDMYPHHAQAVEMAGYVKGRTTTPAVVDLAEQISAAQAPEMDTLKSLLAQWGQPAPAADTGMSGSRNMGGKDGMMSAADMAKLQTLSGAQFDREWLTMMVAHHTGAIDMANKEIRSGKSPDAKALAQQIVNAQRAEIATMTKLLG